MGASGNHTGQRLTDNTDRSSVRAVPHGGRRHLVPTTQLRLSRPHPFFPSSRRRHLILGLRSQPLKAGDELLIIDGYLAIKDDRVRPQRAEGLDQLGEAGGQVLCVAADEADALAVLVSEYPVAVDLLLVNPAFVVEGRHLGRVHRRDGGRHQIQCRGDGKSGLAATTSEGLPVGRLVFAVPLEVRRAKPLRAAGRSTGLLRPRLAAGNAPTFDLGSGPYGWPGTGRSMLRSIASTVRRTSEDL